MPMPTGAPPPERRSAMPPRSGEGGRLERKAMPTHHSDSIRCLCFVFAVCRSGPNVASAAWQGQPGDRNRRGRGKIQERGERIEIARVCGQ
eukprot:2254159-Pyramimonas_sp.AAC.1